MSNDFDSKFSEGAAESEAATRVAEFAIEKLTLNDIRYLVSGLTPTQILFVKKFLETQFDVSQAAHAAGMTVYEAKVALDVNENIRTICLWYMHKQALPEQEIFARLAVMARADFGSFLKKRKVGIYNKDMEEVDSYDVWELDIELMQKRGLTYLIKKLSYTKEGIMQWEFHDSMKALSLLAKMYGMFDQVASFQIDWSTLSQQQIERIARGEDPRTVVMTPNALPQTAEEANSTQSKFN